MKTAPYSWGPSCRFYTEAETIWPARCGGSRSASNLTRNRTDVMIGTPCRFSPHLGLFETLELGNFWIAMGKLGDDVLRGWDG